MGQSLVELLRKRDELLEKIAAAEAGVEDHKVSAEELAVLRKHASSLSQELAQRGHAEHRWN